jgi:hypothetical protein
VNVLECLHVDGSTEVAPISATYVHNHVPPVRVLLALVRLYPQDRCVVEEAGRGETWNHHDLRTQSVSHPQQEGD